MSSSAESQSPIVEVRGLEKNYGAIRALRGVDVTFRQGEIHGLVGANGAGKSTLVRSLAGLEQPDGGEIIIRGESAAIHSPNEASKHGFAFIHQELNLVQNFTGVQNIMLGTHPGGGLTWGSFKGMPPRVKEVADRIGIDFDLRRPVSTYSVHQQWLVSIAHALIMDSKLIAMDEPTGSLDAEESERLLGVAKDLAKDGVSVLFISHRLDEVIDICDRVTVFRDGSVSMKLEGDEITRPNLIQGIVGREVVAGSGRVGRDLSDREVILAAKDIRRGRNLRGATLDLKRGELLGVAGLVGAGRTELARVIFGADRPDSGSMRLQGKMYVPKSVSDAIARRVAYVPEERRAEALFLGLSIESNLHVATWQKRKSPGSPFTSSRKATRDAKRVCTDLGVVIRSGNTKQPIGSLSGGNQQKVVIGRWLETNPEILVMDEPTRGVDVGARADIYGRIREISETGTSVIVISSEFEELLECDRVAVMANGRIVGELTGDQITVQEMLRLCYS